MKLNPVNASFTIVPHFREVLYSFIIHNTDNVEKKKPSFKKKNNFFRPIGPELSSKY